MSDRVASNSFLREIWGLYIAGCLIFVVRMLVRLRTVGARGFTWDDYFALSAFLFYTVDAVVVDRSHVLGTSVDYPNEVLAAMTPAELQATSLGNKYQFVAWFSYSALIWSMKGTMVMFYSRLTSGLQEQRLVRYLGLICVATYLGVLLTIFLGCLPFSNNWAVWPDPGLKCTFRLQNIAVVSSFNIATDIALLSVPIPLIRKLQVPRKQKIVIGLFLLTGLMVIAAAIIRVVLTLGSNPSTLTIDLWGVRETIVALLCVNLPIFRPLFTRSFWSRNYSPTSNSTTTGSRKNRSKFASRLGETGNDSMPDVVGLREGSEDGIASTAGHSYVLHDLKDVGKEQVIVERQVWIESAEIGDEEHGNRTMVKTQLPSGW